MSLAKLVACGWRDVRGRVRGGGGAVSDYGVSLPDPVAGLRFEKGAADGTMRPVASARVAAAALLGATTPAVEQALLSAGEALYAKN